MNDSSQPLHKWSLVKISSNRLVLVVKNELFLYGIIQMITILYQDLHKLPYKTVSVIIPAYNAEEWIAEAIQSALDQTYPPLEILVIDDGSADQTAAIAEVFGPPVRVLRQENAGVSTARNRGIRSAVGDYIAFLDADDLWHPEKLKLQVNLMEERGYRWATCRSVQFEWVDGKKVTHQLPLPPEGNILLTLFTSDTMMLPTPSIIVDRSIFTQVGNFDEGPDGRYGEDIDMWMRIARVFPIGAVQQELVWVRTFSSGMMGTFDILQKAHLIIHHKEKVVERSPELAGLRRKPYSSVYNAYGATLFKRGDYTAARQCYRSSLKWQPFQIEAPLRLALLALDKAWIDRVVKLKRALYKFLKKNNLNTTRAEK